MLACCLNMYLVRDKTMLVEFDAQKNVQAASKHGSSNLSMAGVQFLLHTPLSYHIKSSSLCAKLFEFDIAIIKILIDFFSHLVYGRYMYSFVCSKNA
jgi:hypothetical protein